MSALHDPSLIEKVRHYSQEEGLNDTEIADKLGYSRKTIVWIRKENSIPKCNLENKRDKAQLCFECKKPYFVRRKSKIGEEVCPDCGPKVKMSANTCI